MACNLQWSRLGFQLRVKITWSHCCASHTEVCKADASYLVPFSGAHTLLKIPSVHFHPYQYFETVKMMRLSTEQLEQKPYCLKGNK